MVGYFRRVAGQMEGERGRGEREREMCWNGERLWRKERPKEGLKAVGKENIKGPKEGRNNAH